MKTISRLFAVMAIALTAVSANAQEKWFIELNGGARLSFNIEDIRQMYSTVEAIDDAQEYSVTWGKTGYYYESGYARDISQSNWKADKTVGYEWSSYFDNPSGDGKRVLEHENDSAHANGVGNRRMSTSGEFQEQMDKYYWVIELNDGTKKSFSIDDIRQMYSIIIDDTHEFIDLGLSVKWATCNVGAYRPEDYGDYFAWGETEPYYEPDYVQEEPQSHWKAGKSDGYSWSSYFDNPSGDGQTFTKYKINGGQTVLDLEDDAAHANWGGNWRMPTKEELSELSNSNNCTWTWYDDSNTEFGGVAGYKVISKKSGYEGHFIFLPAAGWRRGTSIYDVGNYSYYWSNSLVYSNFAYFLGFNSGGHSTNYYYRSDGTSIRPVQTIKVTSIELDCHELELKQGQQYMLNAVFQPSRSANLLATWTTSDPLVAVVDNTGNVVATGLGQCTITATVDGHTSSCVIIVVAFEPEYVDLGLSVKWATCNVGATSPEEYGDYFAWGETKPYYEPGYAQEDYQIHWKAGITDGYYWSSYFDNPSGDGETFTKYNFNGGKMVLDLEDDAAQVNWGGAWRMPSQEELIELSDSDNCTWAWYSSGNTEFGGKAGYKVTSKKSGYEENFIFLPASGGRFYTNLSAGYYGSYWSNSLSRQDCYAYYLRFDIDSKGRNSNAVGRMNGLSVRPVQSIEITSIEFDRQELVLKQGQLYMLNAVFQPARFTNKFATWTTSDPSVAIVDNTGNVSAIGIGQCTITATAAGNTASCVITVIAFEPEYIDLGLRVRWATCNVGATSPEEFGDYFAWGETEPYYEPGYAQENPQIHRKNGKTDGYEWSSYFDNPSGDGLTFIKYNDESGKYILDLDDDVAHAKWGGDWRMPTYAELKELSNENNCTWTWYPSGNTEFDGKAGYKVTSKKSGYEGNFIFLPAAGRRIGPFINNVGHGFYWSTSLYYENFAIMQYFWSNSCYASYNDRCYGLSVRPVQNVVVTSIVLDRQELELKQGQQYMFNAVFQPEWFTNNYATWTTSDPSVAIVDNTGNVVAIGIGQCTITATADGKTASCSITVIAFEKECVDLGLSVKWANCNVGASSLAEYGDYFAWGETEPYYESGYAQENPQNHWKEGKSGSYLWRSYFDNPSGNGKTFIKYNVNGGNTVLDLEDDAAYANWGGDWRMPTEGELSELFNSDNCTWTWYSYGNTEFGGKAGYKVMSKKSGYEGNFIFLPASGGRDGSNLSSVGYAGYYWASSLNGSTSYFAYGLSFYPSRRSVNNNGYRCYGHCVRPVQSVEVTNIELDRQELELKQGQQYLFNAVFQPARSANLLATWTTSDSSVVVVDKWGRVTAIGIGQCTITATVAGNTSSCVITVVAFEPECVDLGLSVKWATCNVGAYIPEEYGDYFAWGETEPYYESGFAQEDFQCRWKTGKSIGYQWNSYFDNQSGDGKTFSKYNANSGKTVLDLEDDAAHANWGGDWRMPTEEEMSELTNPDNCTWTWYPSGNTEFGGIAGCKVTSKKSGYEGNSIYLPVAGSRYGTDLYEVGSYGSYWCSSLSAGNSSGAILLELVLGNCYMCGGYRYEGLSIRPVCE